MQKLSVKRIWLVTVGWWRWIWPVEQMVYEWPRMDNEIQKILWDFEMAIDDGQTARPSDSRYS